MKWYQLRAACLLVIGLASGSQAEVYKLVDLGTPEGATSYATGINNLGQVVGASIQHGIKYRAFLWTAEGGIINLGTLGGDESFAQDINESEQIIGRSRDHDASLRAFLWEQGKGMRDLGTLGGNRSSAFGINNSGQVVGYSFDADGNERAFLWEEATGMQNLNDLIDPDLGWTLTSAASINDHGHIVGRGLQGKTRAFMLVPEPSSIALFL